MITKQQLDEAIDYLSRRKIGEAFSPNGLKQIDIVLEAAKLYSEGMEE